MPRFMFFTCPVAHTHTIYYLALAMNFYVYPLYHIHIHILNPSPDLPLDPVFATTLYCLKYFNLRISPCPLLTLLDHPLLPLYKWFPW